MIWNNFNFEYLLSEELVKMNNEIYGFSDFCVVCGAFKLIGAKPYYIETHWLYAQCSNKDVRQLLAHTRSSLILIGLLQFVCTKDFTNLQYLRLTCINLD